MTTRVIVNPRSAHGRTRRRWQTLAAKLERTLGELDIVFTARPFHAATLAREGLEAGCDTIIAVGGDGTIGEAVNGFFADGEPIRPDARFGILMHGTGGDFRRTFAIPLEAGEQVDILAAGATRRIDVGHIRYLDHDGRPSRRHFVNIASLGMSGRVCTAVNRARFSKLLGGRFAFHLASLNTALGYRNQAIRLTIDNGPSTEYVSNTVAVCNCRSFGGGMTVAPHADPTDGLFDVVIIGDFTRAEVFRSMGLIYRGTHLDHPKVTHFQAREIHAEPLIDDEPVLLEVDGEGPGRLPATITLMPGALNMIVPEELASR